MNIILETKWRHSMQYFWFRDWMSFEESFIAISVFDYYCFQNVHAYSTACMI